MNVVVARRFTRIPSKQSTFLSWTLPGLGFLARRATSVATGVVRPSVPGEPSDFARHHGHAAAPGRVWFAVRLPAVIRHPEPVRVRREEHAVLALVTLTLLREGRGWMGGWLGSVGVGWWDRRRYFLIRSGSAGRGGPHGNTRTADG